MRYNKNEVSLKSKMEFEQRTQNLVNVEVTEDEKNENSKTNELNTNDAVGDDELITADTKEKLKSYSWGICIPRIDLVAKIQDGTDQKTMNEYVGHFEETSVLDGNVGLAAHNRGYPVNYFARLKELEVGDDIFYKYENYIRKYKVISTIIIKDTDWTRLEDTKDNVLTLITCVENRPSYRRCVQAQETED